MSVCALNVSNVSYVSLAVGVLVETQLEWAISVLLYGALEYF